MPRTPGAQSQQDASVLETLQSPQTAARNPYPGPRPFLTVEKQCFFGREREAQRLRSLVLANSIVLLYAQSGAGKTSLIHAGLIPDLQRREITVFPVLRIRALGHEEPFTGITNPYVRSLAGSWTGASGADPTEVRNLSDLLAVLASALDAGRGEPRVLIIDQFEEIFSYLPESWESRSDFFTQVQEALTADRDLRILLSMREDYLPQTDPYTVLVDNHLQQRLRLERLRRPQAILAVAGPLATTGRAFAEGAAEYLVDQLLEIRVERDGHLEKLPGEYVEPVQLQVICQRLWDDLPRGLQKITVEDLRDSSDVDDLLGGFYTRTVHEAAQHGRMREGRLRDWVESALVTSLGTRGLEHRQAALEAGTTQEAIEELVDGHLLRAERRAGSDWYELTHDRFIAPIKASNATFRERAAHRRRRRIAAIGVPLLVALGGAVAALVSAPAPATVRSVIKATNATTFVSTRHGVATTVTTTGTTVTTLTRPAGRRKTVTKTVGRPALARTATHYVTSAGPTVTVRGKTVIQTPATHTVTVTASATVRTTLTSTTTVSAPTSTGTTTTTTSTIRAPTSTSTTTVTTTKSASAAP
jgi:hypothetical protein